VKGRRWLSDAGLLKSLFGLVYGEVFDGGQKIVTAEVAFALHFLHI
jgi:hypothetical protein